MTETAARRANQSERRSMRIAPPKVKRERKSKQEIICSSFASSSLLCSLSLLFLLAVKRDSISLPCQRIEQFSLFCLPNMFSVSSVFHCFALAAVLVNCFLLSKVNGDAHQYGSLDLAGFVNTSRAHSQSAVHFNNEHRFQETVSLMPKCSPAVR